MIYYSSPHILLLYPYRTSQHSLYSQVLSNLYFLVCAIPSACYTFSCLFSKKSPTHFVKTWLKCQPRPQVTNSEQPESLLLPFIKARKHIGHVKKAGLTQSCYLSLVLTPNWASSTIFSLLNIIFHTGL